MTRTLNLMPGGKILPEGAHDFLRKRGCEGLGLVLLASAVWASVAVLGYSAGDPSLNSAGPATPTNLLGVSGAIAADLLLQSLDAPLNPPSAEQESLLRQVGCLCPKTNKYLQ